MLKRIMEHALRYHFKASIHKGGKSLGEEKAKSGRVKGSLCSALKTRLVAITFVLSLVVLHIKHISNVECDWKLFLSGSHVQR